MVTQVLFKVCLIFDLEKPRITQGLTFICIKSGDDEEALHTGDIIILEQRLL